MHSPSPGTAEPAETPRLHVVKEEPAHAPTPATRRPAPWLKPLVFACACLPAGKIALDLVRNHLGADPIAQILNRLGWWTLFFLAAVLACTPLKITLKWTWPMRVRRMLGLFAFFYGLLHFVTYVAVDQGLDLDAIWKDIVKRKFMTVGFAALMTLVPLAVTSTNGWVRRIGFARWKRVHRLVYVAAGLGVIHFIWRVKADLREPLTFGAVIALLLVLRLYPTLRAAVSRA